MDKKNCIYYYQFVGLIFYQIEVIHLVHKKMNSFKHIEAHIDKHKNGVFIT